MTALVQGTVYRLTVMTRRNIRFLYSGTDIVVYRSTLYYLPIECMTVLLLSLRIDYFIAFALPPGTVPQYPYALDLPRGLLVVILALCWRIMFLIDGKRNLTLYNV